MDGRPVNLQDPVSDMNGVFHIRTNAIGINPGGGKRQSGENSSSSEKNPTFLLAPHILSERDAEI